jgi:hypothetical protein
MDAKNILYKLIYVPIMKRWGDDQHGHHYLLGAFDNLDKAIEMAKAEREDRAGKYEWVIEAYPLNLGRDSKISSKIYRVAKSPEMNCLLDSEREEVLSCQEEYKKYYNKATRATMLSDRDNAIESKKFWEEKVEELNKLLVNENE